MQRHLWECSVKAADTVPSGTTATLQALSSHHFLVAHLHHCHLHHTCSPHPLHQQHRWNRLQLFLPCQLFRRMPQHQSLWHPTPHLCSHEDPAVPAWHQDAWSQEIWELSTQTVHRLCYCNVLLHTSPVNCSAMYHNLRKGDVVWSYCLVLRTAANAVTGRWV